MTRSELVLEIAVLQAKARCGQSVYMDGSHNPTPYEMREAEFLVRGIEHNYPEWEFDE